MREFSHPIRKIEGEIEDLQIEIDRKEQELKQATDEFAALSKKKELLEIEIEEFYAEKKRKIQEKRRLEFEYNE